MKKKKRVLLVIIAVMAVGLMILGLQTLRWYVAWTNQRMPILTFAYNDKANDIYLLDSKGNLYFINRDTKKTNRLEWVEDTIYALQNDLTPEWLELVGKTDAKKLQKHYYTFCKVIKNPKFSIYPTVNTVPAVEPNTQYTTPEEYWFGCVARGDKYEMKNLYLAGYLEYKATDQRAGQIANWIREEAMKYKKIRSFELQHLD